MKKYGFSLRLTEDAELIKWLEDTKTPDRNTSRIVREALELLKKSEER